MSNDKKNVKEVASCIRVLLKTDGTEAKVKDIVELIENEDLSDPVALKNKIKNDMRAKQEALENQPTRRDDLRTFMVEHYDILKDNPNVFDALKKSYCQGRINKAQREEMLKNLMAACEDQEEVDETPASADVIEETSGYDF